MRDVGGQELHYLQGAVEEYLQEVEEYSQGEVEEK